MNASTIADIVDSMDHVIEEQQKLIKILRNALLQYISIEEVADMSYSFNYEFVCDISERVERKYV